MVALRYVFCAFQFGNFNNYFFILFIVFKLYLKYYVKLTMLIFNNKIGCYVLDQM